VGSDIGFGGLPGERWTQRRSDTSHASPAAVRFTGVRVHVVPPAPGAAVTNTGHVDPAAVSLGLWPRADSEAHDGCAVPFGTAHPPSYRHALTHPAASRSEASSATAGFQRCRELRDDARSWVAPRHLRRTLAHLARLATDACRERTSPMSHPYSRWVLPLERVADVPGRAVVERREEVVVGTTAAGARQTARITAAIENGMNEARCPHCQR